MTSTPDQAAREARRAHLRAEYARALRPAIEALSSEQASLMAGMMPGLVLGLVGWGTAIALLVRHPWPDTWWGDPASWQVVGLAVLLVLGVRRAAHWLDGGRAARFKASADTFERDVLPRVFATLRPRASYKKGAAVDRGWIRRSALVPGANEYGCRHLVKWSTGGIRVQMARVDAAEVTTQRDGDTTRISVVRGVVAIATMPVQVPGHVRVGRRDTDQLGLEPLPGHKDVTPAMLSRVPGSAPPAWLHDDYVATTDSAAVAALVLTPDVIGVLNALREQGRSVRLAVAHGEVFLVLERWAAWFGDLAGRLDEDRYVEMGEFMDAVDTIALAVTARMTAP
ncbi:hypothetical protein [Luteitalea sp. TBR-22]|uniref:hypothetical protein n=1 Tax=Luteitalea sp. TBR-22 TaxID=2802971 RepID=UPI001EF6BC19|nr:hypothetical protein [Luteitalea sp. TBR-22]